MTPPAVRRPKPASRRAAGWRVPGGRRRERLAGAVPLDRGHQRVLVVRGLPAQLAPGLRGAEGPPQRRGAQLAGGDRRRAGRLLEPARQRDRRADRQLHRRRLDAGQPPQVGEQAIEREVAIAQDVALAHHAALVGQQLAARDVVGVHDVERAVDIGGDLAAQEAADELGRGAVEVAGAEDVRGVDDDDRQALRRQAHGDALGLVLGVHVGQAEASRAEDAVLVGRRAAPRRADRCDRRRVDDTLDAGAQRFLEHHTGALDVHAEEVVGARGAATFAPPDGRPGRRRPGRGARRGGPARRR